MGGKQLKISLSKYDGGHKTKERFSNYNIWPKQKFKLIFMFGEFKEDFTKHADEIIDGMELLIFVTILLEYLEHNR